ncbi:ABC transporter substrate-binding protein [Paenibacillus daejeonensis]|uniref:ABC transporter substrate-binding protein n=1 Tax=Paenibacillus daejeonensis TaxID=135193 RepID=UPI0003824A0D|nr:helix-turn-helix domain-containing protein [Paenibacillus daejeonensis]
MTILDQLPLWQHSAIRVLDIRRSVLEPGEMEHVPRLPANTFVLIADGAAQVIIDGRTYDAPEGYVCHAGKGAELAVTEAHEQAVYYLLYYKAALVSPARLELERMMRENNPFRAQYGLAPLRPLQLYIKMDRMHQQWHKNTPLERFHVRALFHQWIYELLNQLHEAGDSAAMLQPDPVRAAMLFIEEHYAEPLTLSELASQLQYGTRQLQRQFKASLRTSPMEYVNQIRMRQAQTLLYSTGAPIREVAEAVGYTDSYYFSRAFKKYTGMSPMQYRARCRRSPSLMSPSPIGARGVLPYSVNEDENHYHYTRGGETPLLRRTKGTLAVSLLLSLMLIIGACSNAGPGPANGTGTNAPANNATQGTNANASNNAAQTAQGNYPLTIQDLRGDFTLEQKLERIVVLDNKFADQLIAIDEKPIGSVTSAGSDTDFPEYLMDKLTDVKVLGTRDEPNMEAILEMNPDLIICTGFQEQFYDQFSKIAPTLMLDFDEDWRDTLVTMSKILEKEQEAQDLLTAYEQKTAQLKEEFAAKLGDETVALIRPRDGAIRIHPPEHRTGAILYNDLGLNLPPLLNDQDDSYQISLEVLPDVDADHYFLLTNAMFQEDVDSVQDTEVWKSLKAVQQDQVYTVDTTQWIAYYGPIAINLIVDEIAELLLDEA